MPLNIIKQLNWVDILFIIVLIRIGYAAVRSGFLTELFKTLGTILAVYLSLHYCTALSDYLLDFSFFKVMPLEFLDLLSYLILVILGYLVFVVMRIAILHFIKMEAVPKLDRWGAFILSIFRGVLLNSLIVFALMTSTVTYLKDSSLNSYSGVAILKIAPGVYKGIWDGFTSKLMTKEKFNQSIFEGLPLGSPRE